MKILKPIIGQKNTAIKIAQKFWSASEYQKWNLAEGTMCYCGKWHCC